MANLFIGSLAYATTDDTLKAFLRRLARSRTPASSLIVIAVAQKALAS